MSIQKAKAKFDLGFKDLIVWAEQRNYFGCKKKSRKKDFLEVSVNSDSVNHGPPKEDIVRIRRILVFLSLFILMRLMESRY